MMHSSYVVRLQIEHITPAFVLCTCARVHVLSLRLTLASSVYRFFCSQFVAGMLMQTGRVTIHDQDYVPIPADWPLFRGSILAAPLLIRLQGPPRAAPQDAEGSQSGTRRPHKGVRLVRLLVT